MNVRMTLLLLPVLGAWMLQGCTHYSIAAASPDLEEVKRVWVFCTKCVANDKCKEKQECERDTMSQLGVAFEKAVTAQRVDVIRYLVEVARLDLNTEGLNPLHTVAYYNSPREHEILAYLIERGSDVNRVSSGHARSALNVAIWKRNTPGARLLLAHGADPSIRSDRGWDACMFAHRWSHWEIMPDLPGCCARFLEKRWDGDPDEARVRPPELRAACNTSGTSAPKP